MKVLVCGSRRFPDPFRVSLAVDARIRELPPFSFVIHGGAQGADLMAADAARRHGHYTAEFFPDWETHGKKAGIIRNLAMLDEKPELVIAFWDGKSKGTAHTMTEARKRGIPVEVHAA